MLARKVHPQIHSSPLDRGAMSYRNSNCTAGQMRRRQLGGSLYQRTLRITAELPMARGLGAARHAVVILRNKRISCFQSSGCRAASRPSYQFLFGEVILILGQTVRRLLHRV
jgi:hypothetical protein